MKQRKANRLKGYDYSQDNLYFVTSCVHDMICCFGHVGTGRDLSGDISRDLSGNDDDNTETGYDLSLLEPRMILNEYGKIADQQWYWLAAQYPYVVLHEFIVMPNHMHGIIEINRNAPVGTGRDLSDNAGRDLSDNAGRDLSDNAGRDLSDNAGRDLSDNNDRNTRTGRDLSLPLKIKPLSELMGAYKTTVSKQIHLLGYADFAWQRSFHDHIIRDEESYERISNYIINNPNSWDQDKFFKR